MSAPTVVLAGEHVAERINASLPGAVEEANDGWALVQRDRIVDVCRFVRDDAELDAQFLSLLSGVDRYDYFEVVYHVASLAKNHRFTLKVRAGDHDQPEVPSVTSVWQGAGLQEREAFDLLGIRFAGHPDLRRIFLWDGFPGHPLRKDFTTLPGGFKPGLQRFPYEDPEQWGGEARVP